jgi:1,4-dihydroxy-2-naphthoate octaprenyltransferase
MARLVSKVAAAVSRRKPLFPRVLVATRPWSFPAALSPLLITFTILKIDGNLELNHAILFSLGMVALQAAANLLNSFCDYRNGLDKPDTAGDRTLVDNLVTRDEFPFLFLSVGTVWFVSFVLTLPSASVVLTEYLAVYVFGLALSILYSAGSPPLKYIGFGDIAVFLSFGPLLVTAGTWACCVNPEAASTKRIILSSIPAAFLVVAILHANNHRDMQVDSKNAARTVSVRLGKTMSKYYYGFLVISPSIMSSLLAFVLPESRGLLAGLFVLPLAIRLTKMVAVDKFARDIDAETAKIMLLFGVLTSLGLLVVRA